MASRFSPITASKTSAWSATNPVVAGASVRAASSLRIHTTLRARVTSNGADMTMADTTIAVRASGSALDPAASELASESVRATEPSTVDIKRQAAEKSAAVFVSPSQLRRMGGASDTHQLYP